MSTFILSMLPLKIVVGLMIGLILGPLPCFFAARMNIGESHHRLQSLD